MILTDINNDPDNKVVFLCFVCFGIYCLVSFSSFLEPCYTFVTPGSFHSSPHTLGLHEFNEHTPNERLLILASICSLIMSPSK